MKHHKGPHGDPDKGPPMLEGAHHFDKGYQSDEKEFSPLAGQDSPTHGHQRGNAYMKHQNEIARKDESKIKRGKFTKIAYMTLHLPADYKPGKQQLGETRQAMTKTLMKDLETILDQFKHLKKYFVLFHAKPWPNQPNLIKIKPIVMTNKPPMMLSCLLFGVDNESGKLTLEWALPGDWPTWSVGGTNEPVPEVIASVTQAGVRYHYDDLLPS